MNNMRQVHLMETSAESIDIGLLATKQYGPALGFFRDSVDIRDSQPISLEYLAAEIRYSSHFLNRRIRLQRSSRPTELQGLNDNHTLQVR